MTAGMALGGLVRDVGPHKPRVERMTMVLDKGLSLTETQNWLEVAAPYVDVVKLGWGTSGLFPLQTLREKIAMLRAARIGVTPGGTLTELYLLQNRIPELIRDYTDCGFDVVEVSDGTVPMHPRLRSRVIGMLLAEGFRVVTEIGSKEPARDRRMTPHQRADLVAADLEAGATHVIIEARETGTLGFFAESRELLEQPFNEFLQLVDSRRIVFEAPMKNQQVELINRLGPSVSLGNIAPSEVLALETLRQGLRADTMLALHGPPVYVRMGAGPAAAEEASKRGDVVVVVDALRASTTIASALAAGAREVRVVSTVEECVGEVTAAERGGVKVPAADLDNSPLSMANADLHGKSLVITTTNGADCILAAASDPGARVFVGAMANATAVAQAASVLARLTSRGITVVSAGRRGLPAEEDDLSASEIVLSLGAVRLDPHARLVESALPARVFEESESGRGLIQRGLANDVAFCARKDSLSVVPFWDGHRLVRWSDHPAVGMP